MLGYKLTLVATRQHAPGQFATVKAELIPLVHSGTQRWNEEMMGRISDAASRMSGKQLDPTPDPEQVRLATKVAEARLIEADADVDAAAAALERHDERPFAALYRNLRAVSGGPSPSQEEHALLNPILQELYESAASAVRTNKRDAPHRKTERVRPGRDMSLVWFFVVLFVAAVAGGLVGGELSGRVFSAIGAVVGFVALAMVLLGLGAFFDAQARKRSDLTPEMRGVFDRMVTGKENPTVEEVAAAKRRLRGE